MIASGTSSCLLPEISYNMVSFQDVKPLQHAEPLSQSTIIGLVSIVGLPLSQPPSRVDPVSQSAIIGLFSIVGAPLLVFGMYCHSDRLLSLLLLPLHPRKQGKPPEKRGQESTTRSYEGTLAWHWFGPSGVQTPPGPRTADTRLGQKGSEKVWPGACCV